MGILSVVKEDVEKLVNEGFDNEYIFKSVGMDKNIIGYIISYLKAQKLKNNSKINTKINKGG
jgi:hypothetical protein